MLKVQIEGVRVKGSGLRVRVHGKSTLTGHVIDLRSLPLFFFVGHVAQDKTRQDETK